MSEQLPLLYEQDGPVVTLTLNLPERRNPITEAPMVDALVGAVERMGRDRSVRVAILIGAGSSFFSGGDVRAMADAAEQRAQMPADTPAYYTARLLHRPPTTPKASSASRSPWGAARCRPSPR